MVRMKKPRLQLRGVNRNKTNGKTDNVRMCVVVHSRFVYRTSFSTYGRHLLTYPNISSIRLWFAFTCRICFSLLSIFSFFISFSLFLYFIRLFLSMCSLFFSDALFAHRFSPLHASPASHSCSNPSHLI